jgi:redox-sensing transcriptional repressor
MRTVIGRHKIVVGVLAVPAAARSLAACWALAAAGARIIFNYTEALLDPPTHVQVLTSNPATQLIAALHQLG